jgi:hypothetical protein
MTRFTVVWIQSALDELAELWLTATDRDEITAAANAIDDYLAQDPASKGIELSEGLRVLLAPPLKIIFATHDADRIVDVLRVKRL